MQIISFSTNPNGKLFNDHFGDIRIADIEKYYCGNVLELRLKNQVMGIVQVVAVREFKFHNISDILSYLNIGKPAAYQADLLKRYYLHQENLTSDSKLVHIAFHYTYRNINVHANLLQEWWQSKLEQNPKQSLTQNTLFNNE